MSAIAGIWNSSGKPVTDREVDALFSHSCPLGSGEGRTVGPRPGLVIQAHVLKFDQHSVTECQPWTFARGSVLTWDGRLDNRDDLRLVLHRDLCGENSDAAIVAAAYVRWGLDCLGRLIGDWSLALWDADLERLILARDVMGNRPLYYTIRNDGIAWATSVDALAACFNLYSSLDDTFVAGRLTFSTPPEVTPYRDVRLLKSGHQLVATKSNPVATRRYWTFSPDVLRYRRPEDYIDHLRMLLVNAVRVRLRANGTVWSHSSGGWDSSTIACIGQRVIEHGEVETSALRTLTGVFPPPFPHVEDEYVRAVERTTGIRTVRQLLSFYPSFEETLGLTDPAAFPESCLLEQPVINAGDKVVLTGQLGNLAMWRSGATLSVLEPLTTGHPIEFVKLCFQRAAHMKRPLPTMLWTLFSRLPATEIFQAGRDPRVGQRSRSRSTDKLKESTFGLTAKTLAALMPHDHPSDVSTAEFPIVKRRLVRAFYRFASTGVLMSPHYTPKIWYTSPLSHRPLLEFVLATPLMAFWDPTTAASALRRALTGILPDEFLTRTTKGNIGPGASRLKRDFAERTERSPILREPMASWELVKRGYLDAADAQHYIDAWREGSRPQARFNWIRLEAWLRTMAALERNGVSLERQHYAVGR